MLCVYLHLLLPIVFDVSANASPSKNQRLKRRFPHSQEGLEWDNDVRKGLASLAAKPQVAEFVVAGIWRLTHN